MELKDYRLIMDEIDDQLVELFRRRMELSAEIASYKKERGLPILDAGRERDKMKQLRAKVPQELRNYTSVLYSSLFELSRSCQSRQMQQYTDLNHRISHAIDNTPNLFPQDVTVGICGAEGTLAQTACEKLFRIPFIMYFNNLEGVFSAIEKGLCRYAVIPVDNGTEDSFKKICNLMIRRNCSIVRSVRLKADHNLLARPSTRLEDVKEIVAHEQAINQCADYLQKLGADVKITVCENMTIAAKQVAQSQRHDIAAICTRTCPELYGIRSLHSSIQDRENNDTRFLCISKNLEIYPGADRTSIMLTLPHKPGALYKLLARFYALGINITRLESRPIPGRDLEIQFHFDLETSIYSQEFIQIICELSASCEEFFYLGSYSEVV